METTTNGWQVIDRDAGVLCLEYSFNEKGRAHTFAAKIADGGLLVVSPGTGLSEGAYEDLAEFGEVRAVVAPNGFHHLGQGEWRQRFPNAKFYAAPETVARIKKQNPDIAEFTDISELGAVLGESVGYRTACSTKCGENWFWVKTESGYVWYGSDLVCNWEKFPGPLPFRLLWKWTGSGPGFKLFHLAMMPILKDKKAVLRELREDVEKYPPRYIVPAHGDHIHHDAAADEWKQLLDKAV